MSEDTAILELTIHEAELILTSIGFVYDNECPAEWRENKDKYIDLYERILIQFPELSTKKDRLGSVLYNIKEMRKQ